MGYTIRIGGLEVECATPEDALALIRKAEGSHGPAAQPTEPPRPPRAPRPAAAPKGVTTARTRRKRVRAGRIEGAYAKAILAMLSHPQGITGAELSTAVGFEKVARLPGFMTAVRRELKRCGLPADQVIQKKRVYEESNWISRFSVSPRYVDDLRRLVA